MLDYDRYLGLLRTYGFKGPLLLHGLSEAQVPSCVAFLRGKLGNLRLEDRGLRTTERAPSSQPSE